MGDFKLLSAGDEDGRLRIALFGEFDLAGVKPFREVVAPAIGSDTYRDIEFDLERLTFIDSSGLHALAEADRAMRTRGGSVHVVCSAPHLLKIFQLIGLDRVLTIVAHPQPARAAA
jgi:anti-anti-sigma factor